MTQKKKPDPKEAAMLAAIERLEEMRKAVNNMDALLEARNKGRISAREYKRRMARLEAKEAKP